MASSDAIVLAFVSRRSLRRKNSGDKEGEGPLQLSSSSTCGFFTPYNPSIFLRQVMRSPTAFWRNFFLCPRETVTCSRRIILRHETFLLVTFTLRASGHNHFYDRPSLCLVLSLSSDGPQTSSPVEGRRGEV